MNKVSGLGFAVWINWLFFILLVAIAGVVGWAIFNQNDSSQTTKIQALIILTAAVLLPAVIFMMNAILLGKISKKDTNSQPPPPLSDLK